MTIQVKKIALAEHQQQLQDKPVTSNYLGLVADLEVECTIRIGSIELSIAELGNLKIGQLITLKQETNEPIEIVLKDKVIARGELMSYEDHFAVQITEVNHQ